MPKRFREAAGLILVASFIASGGCSRAIKQVYYEFRGAKAKIYPMREVEPQVFASYKSIAFAPATSDSGERICPPTLLEEYDRAGREVVQQLVDHFPGGPPTLRITSDLLYFQKKGIFSGAEVLTRVRMSKGDQAVFECIVKSESKALTRHGEDDLSQSCAKAIGDFLIEQLEKVSGSGESD